MTTVNETIKKILTDTQVAKLFSILDRNADQTADNIKNAKPLQKEFKLLYNLLPKGADGWVDQTVDEFKMFRKLCKDRTTDRLITREEYTVTWYETVDAAGEKEWREASGDVEIDPTKFPTFTVTGSLADPRKRHKTDNKLLKKMVIDPTSKLIETAERQAFSRLKPKKPRDGVTKTDDAGKTFDKLSKKLIDFRDELIKDEFPVKSEPDFKKALANLKSALGLGVK